MTKKPRELSTKVTAKDIYMQHESNSVEVMVNPNNNSVRIEFKRPIKFIEFPPDIARRLADLINEKSLMITGRIS